MFWKRFPNKKPKKSGWYQCTISFQRLTTDDGKDVYQTYVMDLYYYKGTERFIDNRARNIFDSYEVYAYREGAYQKVRLNYWDSPNCDRTKHVVAWRKLPKPYLIKGRRYYHETNSKRAH